MADKFDTTDNDHRVKPAAAASDVRFQRPPKIDRGEKSLAKPRSRINTSSPSEFALSETMKPEAASQLLAIMDLASPQIEAIEGFSLLKGTLEKLAAGKALEQDDRSILSGVDSFFYPQENVGKLPSDFASWAATFVKTAERLGVGKRDKPLYA